MANPQVPQNGNADAAATAAAFRAKATFMKTWKPQSTPSNRDRLELYGLHKQAVSGDAPANIPQDASVASKTKYQAWRSKRGLSQVEAMTLYCQECDRQIRVYGSVPQTPQNTPNYGDQQQQTPMLMPRGLAAIPLLCAAAAESRVSYLRRLAHTTPDTAWWARQEPLCAPPGTLVALPESILISMAGLVESMSLHCEGVVPLPTTVVQSWLWPLHHAFLNLWMAIILIITSESAAFTLVKTLLWGARRTGITLEQVWTEEIGQAANAAGALCETHQPVVTRLVGLSLMPYGVLEGLTEALVEYGGHTLGSLAYILAMLATWWYWFVVMPWLTFCLLVVATMSGTCFALIDLAGV